jgi:adenine phosphoribosyltransferase
MKNENLGSRVTNLIRLVPDFPRPGIRIRDISPVVEGDPDLFASVIDEMAGFFRSHPPDTFMCIESWGFIFGAPVAYLLGVRLCVARRPGKLPLEAISETYDMSYAEGRALAIQENVIRPGSNIVIIDDVVASGETALAAIKLIERAKGRCVGVGCLAAFPNWGLRRIEDSGVHVHSIVHL